MVNTLVLALGAALVATNVHGQVIGETSVVCQSGWEWASNTLGQNPCLVTAYLQAECAGGSFTINPLPVGYHYIGPTNATDTQNPCICSTPVYNLESACGACQNRTYIAWEFWHQSCPASMVAPEGIYDQVIPGGTLVPNWAYLKPSEYDDFFNPNASKLTGDLPESSVGLVSSTVSSSGTLRTSLISSFPTQTSTTSTTSTSTKAGGGKSSTNVGAIAGGVAGGVFGLGLLCLLGFWLLRNKNRPPPAGGATGGKGIPETGAVGGQVTGGSTGGVNGAGGYVPSMMTGPTLASGGSGGAGAPVGPMPIYNPNDPSTFPQPYGQPQSPPAFPAAGGVQPQPGYYGPAGGPNAGGPQMPYSGMPEV